MIKIQTVFYGDFKQIVGDLTTKYGSGQVYYATYMLSSVTHYQAVAIFARQIVFLSSTTNFISSLTTDFPAVVQLTSNADQTTQWGFTGDMAI